MSSCWRETAAGENMFDVFTVTTWTQNFNLNQKQTDSYEVCVAAFGMID